MLVVKCFGFKLKQVVTCRVRNVIGRLRVEIR